MFHWLVYFLVRSYVAALLAIPQETAIHLSRTAARLVFFLDPIHRNRTIRHLRFAYGEALPEKEARRLARRIFEHQGRHMIEFFHYLRRRIEFRVENLDHLRKAHALGRGVVLVSGHLGCFTLIGHAIRDTGIPFSGIIKLQKNPPLMNWVRNLFERNYGVEVVYKHEARSEVSTLLREGKIVIFFADQHPRGSGVPITFFGHAAEAAVGPAVFAKRCGSPVVPFSAPELPDGTHLLRFEEPIDPKSLSLEEISQQWHSLLEREIRKYPEQWMWMHRRWRGRDLK